MFRTTSNARICKGTASDSKRAPLLQVTNQQTTILIVSPSRVGKHAHVAYPDVHAQVSTFDACMHN